jgi:SAM-dependent methyltransferase
MDATTVPVTYSHAGVSVSDSYLWPPLRRAIASRTWPNHRAFDLGCGVGENANVLSQLGFKVTGVDISETGIAVANQSFPHLNLSVGSAYEDLATKYGTFPLVISLEVVEHCIDPRAYARTVYNLLEPGGMALISTPYHGWLKNVVLSAAGKWDHHHDPLNDGGHIKFFSVAKFTALFNETGFLVTRIDRAGRIPPLAKSMIAVVTK